MIIDPQLGLFRLPMPSGLDLYDTVIQRVAVRSEKPPGVIMHFAVIDDGALLVGTAFRDSPSAARGFLEYGAPEAQNAMRESGVNADLTREVLEIERIEVGPAAVLGPLELSPIGRVAAAFYEYESESVEQFRREVPARNAIDQGQPGQIIKVAYGSADRVCAIEFWSDREAGEEAYSAMQQEGSAFGDLRWLSPHMLIISELSSDAERRFAREASGPVEL